MLLLLLCLSLRSWFAVSGTPAHDDDVRLTKIYVSSDAACVSPGHTSSCACALRRSFGALSELLSRARVCELNILLLVRRDSRKCVWQIKNIVTGWYCFAWKTDFPRRPITVALFTRNINERPSAQGPVFEQWTQIPAQANTLVWRCVRGTIIIKIIIINIIGRHDGAHYRHK